MNKKWTEEEEKKVIELISQKFNHIEIAESLDRSVRSISNKCEKMRLKVKPKDYREKKECLYCASSFTALIKEKRKFCTSSCAASFNGKQRKHSEETKEKISLKLKGKTVAEYIRDKIKGKKNGNYKGGVSYRNFNIDINDNKKRCKTCQEYKIKIYTQHVCNECKSKKKEKELKLKLTCKSCGKINLKTTKKQICKDCKKEYYKYYRPSCNFDFNINLHPDKFNLFLIEEHGWYSPTNKGNNLSGISRDHMYSVKEGFRNDINPKIIGHPANCKLMIHSQNSKKNSECSITFKELLKRISEWDGKD